MNYLKLASLIILFLNYVTQSNTGLTPSNLKTNQDENNTEKSLVISNEDSLEPRDRGLKPILQSLLKQQSDLINQNQTQTLKKFFSKIKSRFNRQKSSTVNYSEFENLETKSPILPRPRTKLPITTDSLSENELATTTVSTDIIRQTLIDQDNDQVKTYHVSINQEKLKDLLISKDKVDILSTNKHSTDPADFDHLDDYKPIKPDLNVMYYPEHKPDFDLDSVLGKLSGLLLTTPGPTSIVSNSDQGALIQVNLETSSKPQEKVSEYFENTSVFGPISTQTTETPIIGPLNSLNSQQIEQGEPSYSNKKDQYNLISVGKLEAVTPIKTTMQFITNDLAQNKPVPSIESIMVDESIGKTDKYVQETVTSTINDQMLNGIYHVSSKEEPGETTPGLADKINVNVQGEVISLSYPDLSETSTTENTKAARTTRRFALLPTVNLLITKKPRIPYWLSNMFSSIVPWTTLKPLKLSTWSVFPMITSMDDQDDLIKENDSTESVSDESKNEQALSTYNHQGHFVGINSGQSLSIPGAINGQGGVLIGRRPSRKPFKARKPLVLFNTKPIIQE